MSKEALALLVNYQWKGNIRELENVIERVLLMTDKEEITPSDIPPEISKFPSGSKGLPDMNKNGIDLDKIVEEIERRYLSEALQIANEEDRGGKGSTRHSDRSGIDSRSME